MEGENTYDIRRYAFCNYLNITGYFLGLALSWPIIKKISKMQKAREEKRTQFVIDTTDKGYTYYKDEIEKWLRNIGFSKYKSKKNGRYLKYYIKGNIFKCGLNYYQKGSNLILETWLCVYGKESPLTFVSYQADEGETKSSSCALDQYGKEQYLDLLRKLITVPEIVAEINEVTLQNNIETPNFKSEQKTEKSSIRKMILAIIIFSLIVTMILRFFGIDRVRRIY